MLRKRTTRTALARCLRVEVDKWAAKSFGDLVRELQEPVAYRSTLEGFEYQTEVVILETTEEYVHVSVGVDDMSLLRAIKPLTWSFLVYHDGRVEK